MKEAPLLLHIPNVPEHVTYAWFAMAVLLGSQWRHVPDSGSLRLQAFRIFLRLWSRLSMTKLRN